MTISDLRTQGYIADTCGNCKRVVVCARKPEGTWLALDPDVKVYTIIELYSGGRVRPEAARNMLSFAEHKC